MKNKKIILAAGVYPPQIGGPAKYAKNLNDEFKKMGYEVSVVTFVLEHKLPPGIRHLYYFGRLFLVAIKGNVIIAFDTLSTGLPATIVAKILGKNCIIRVGGDFLWETYTERNQEMIPLSLFYRDKTKWGMKDKIIFVLTKFVVSHCDAFAFNSKWLLDLFKENYNLLSKKAFVIKNVFDKKTEAVNSPTKNFLWAGRPIFLKNIEILKSAFIEVQKDYPEARLDIVTGITSAELMEKIKNSYVLVLPSISDVMPNFILEGLELGKPFLVTKYSGIGDDFSNCGEFIDPLDRESIKNGICNLLDDKKYSEYRENILKNDIKNSWQDIATSFIKIIDGI